MTTATDGFHRLRDRADRALAARLPVGPPDRLHAAMRYAVLAPGKRMRPLLAYGSAQALGIPLSRVDPIAVALEFIHAYSLIHDDLPAMDDDDYRRGRATCHREFDEAMAILAGDALQALAFQVVAEDASLSGADRGELTAELSRACGSRGMAGGQAIDLAAVGRPLTEPELFEMHELKTGALIRAAVVLPAIVADVAEPVRDTLREYGRLTGLAFQVQDDILDVAGDPEVMGKAAGADQALNKPTFPSILGLERSVETAQSLSTQAVALLSGVGGDTRVLESLARYAVDRAN